MIIASILLFYSCDPDYGIDLDMDGFTKIGSGTIRPQGGDIFLDEIVIEVPEGAFGEIATINVYIDTVMSNHPLGEDAVSPVIHIDQLPEVLFKPIRVKIPWEDQISGDPVMAIGMETYSVSLDTTLYTYKGEVAHIDNDYLICDINAEDFKFKTGGSNYTSTVATGTLFFYENRNFRMALMDDVYSGSGTRSYFSCGAPESGEFIEKGISNGHEYTIKRTISFSGSTVTSECYEIYWDLAMNDFREKRNTATATIVR
ncbi:MAG: hypothetical protein HN352_14805 [Bacteroidetes bacterium]|nr:hypothetical protein [Bacteroidota bacterium]MBT7093061.1 hypothetical protein [Bacteroidota bacterium]